MDARWRWWSYSRILHELSFLATDRLQRESNVLRRQDDHSAGSQALLHAVEVGEEQLRLNLRSVKHPTENDDARPRVTRQDPPRRATKATRRRRTSLSSAKRQLVLVNGGGGKPQCIADVVLPKLGKLVQDISRRHPFGDHGHNGRNRDARPAYARHPYARHPTHDPVIDRDSLEGHVSMSLRGEPVDDRREVRHLDAAFACLLGHACRRSASGVQCDV